MGACLQAALPLVQLAGDQGGVEAVGDDQVLQLPHAAHLQPLHQLLVRHHLSVSPPRAGSAITLNGAQVRKSSRFLRHIAL